MNQVEPHDWDATGLLPRRCLRCYAPKALHPRTGWVRARPLNDKRYIGVDAPHFKEGW